MTTTFLASIYDGKDTEIGYDYQSFVQYKIIHKINYIEIEHKPIQKKDWPLEKLQAMLEVFFNMDDASELAVEYLLTNQEFPDNPN